MLRFVMAGFALAAFAVCVSQAQQEKQGKQPKIQLPTGTWKKTAGDFNLTFQFKGRTLHFSMAEGDKKMDVVADFGASKDGHIFGRVNKIDRNGIDGGPEVGDLFAFKFQMSQDTLTVSDLRGTDSEQARNLIQGEYKGAPVPPKKKKDAK
jgi:hypothetical protein